MKHILSRISYAFVFIFVLSNCSVFEEPNPFDENIVPVTSISFNGSNLNIASVSAVETDRITITANLSSPDITSVRIDSRFRDMESIAGNSVQRSRTLTTLTPTNQQVVFTDLVRNMGSTADAGTPRSGQTIVLEFVATGAGQTTTRRFTISVASAFSLLSTRTAPSVLTVSPNQSRNPSTANPNQVVFLGYTSAGTSAGQRLTKVEVFRRIGFAGVEDVTPIASKNYPGSATATTDSLAYTIPAAEAVGSAIFLRYLATFANGQTVQLNATSATGNPRITLVENALQDLRSGLVFNAVANNSYNMATVAFNGAGTDQTVKDLIFDNVAMSLRSGTGNNTNFVLIPTTANFDFTAATTQTAAAAYTAGTSSTSISSPSIGQVYVCLIRNRTGIDRYGVFRIVGVAPNATAAQSTVAIDFRSLRP